MESLTMSTLFGIWLFAVGAKHSTASSECPGKREGDGGRKRANKRGGDVSA